MDAVTLTKLKILIPPHHNTQLFTFSPESHVLTWLGCSPEVFISWDLQTGLQVGEISTEDGKLACSITYSGSGTMFGVLFRNQGTTTFSTYNVLSSASIYCHLIEGQTMNTIWTNGEFLQFATLELGSLTIWEVKFNSEHLPIEVESLPTPNHFDPSKEFLFLHTLCQLAFACENTIFIWDMQHSKPLLDYVGVEEPWAMTFSPDGHFFACSYRPEISLWKESPTGYILHQTLLFGGLGYPIPLLSPNGQSIAAFCQGRPQQAT